MEQDRVSTVSAVSDRSASENYLYVFCANTYNWRPDRVISQFIKHQSAIKGETSGCCYARCRIN